MVIFWFFARNGGGDWRESLRNTRHEENMQEKAVADKRKKLLRAIPSSIPGVSAVVRGDARTDIREIEALGNMQVLAGYSNPHASRTCRGSRSLPLDAP